MAPPVKRQKRLIALGLGDQGEEAKATSRPAPATSQTKATKSETRASCADTLPKGHATKSNSSSKAQTSRPISLFFHAGTQAQQSDNRKPFKSVAPETEQQEDLIVDDFSTENVNDLEARATGTADDGRKKRPPPGYDNALTSNNKKLHSDSQRFKFTGNASNVGVAPGSPGIAKANARAIDMRPWAEKYGPNTLEELMVQKKKVMDVRNWLEGALRSLDYKRLLILKGPSGAGKTATINMLAKAMDVEILEWKNPVGSQFPSEAHISMSAHFEDFLGRSGKFNKLALVDSNGIVPKTASRTADTLGEETRQRIILLEEFPNTLLSTSAALRSFRSVVLHYLASYRPSLGAYLSKQHDENLNITPIVMIITETRLTTSTAVSDSFTAHRLLGTELLRHPCVSTIEFNPIAFTYLTKALDLVVRKEARQSGRRRIPGPAVLKKLGEAGDIRSAIGSLEFLCLRGEDRDVWGGWVASRAKTGANSLSTLTRLEKDSLAMVAQRESTLEIFHAVGKVVYNKRGDFPPPVAASEAPIQPPRHLHRHVRPRTAQVSADQLMDQMGTDIETFIAALHENFVLSCEGKSFTDNLNGCIDALSDSDILSSPRKGRFDSSGQCGKCILQGAPCDILKQDELRLQVAVRGLLFSLPDPVRRRTNPISGESKFRSDSNKMFYPTSIKLIRWIEETDSLVRQWTDRLRASGVKLGQASGRHDRQSLCLPSSQERASQATVTRQSRYNEDGSELFRTSLGYSKNDLIVESLPYLQKIEQFNADSTYLHGLEGITQFPFNTPWANEILEDEDAGLGNHLTDRATGVPTKGNPTGFTPKANLQQAVGQASKAASTLLLPVEEEVGQLYLSEDDIEDD